MTIENCGEILPGQDWNYYDNDKSKDKLPPFPEDWNERAEIVTVFSKNEYLKNRCTSCNASAILLLFSDRKGSASS